jgi:hypothetical protein
VQIFDQCLDVCLLRGRHLHLQIHVRHLQIVRNRPQSASKLNLRPCVASQGDKIGFIDLIRNQGMRRRTRLRVPRTERDQQ